MRSLQKKRILFSVLGNIFEWYDYTLYISFIPIFKKIFFNFIKDDFLRSAIAFGVFASGYFARPVGGLIFGYLGDVKGRKVALQISIWSMVISSFLIGIIPTSNTIGVSAVLLLVILRIIQGVSVGGEFTSSSAYLIDIAPINKKAFYGSFTMFSLAIGIILGSLFFILLNFLFDQESLVLWGWRVPFLLSILIGFILIKLRNGFEDNHESKITGEVKMKSEPQYSTDSALNSDTLNSIGKIIRDFNSNRRNIVSSLLVSLGDGLPFYVLCISFSGFVSSILSYSNIFVTGIGLLTMLCYSISSLLSGFLSDKFGDKKIMSIGSFLISLSSFLLVIAFSNITFPFLNRYLLLCFISIAFGLSVGFYHGSLPYFLLRSFPARSRGTIVAFIYNIGVTIFGSIAPSICFFILSKFGNNINIAMLLISCCVSFGAIVSFIGIHIRSSEY